MNQVILDVRETDEFNAEHIPNSIHIPLSSFNSKAPPILKSLKGVEILLMCRSGKRANLAAQQIEDLKLGTGLSVKVYQGGILDWKAKGNVTTIQKSGHFPIMRQVLLAAGLMVFFSALATIFLAKQFVYIALVVGGGLSFAGLSGFCLMAEVLAKMPWNKHNTGKQFNL